MRASYSIAETKRDVNLDTTPPRWEKATVKRAGSRHYTDFARSVQKMNKLARLEHRRPRQNQVYAKERALDAADVWGKELGAV